MTGGTFYSRGIDYLEDLAGKLKDLQGFATLVFELIQNADDVEGVSSITFDIRDEGFVVENDGVFSNCCALDNKECPWKEDSSKGHRCDFHRFRHVAGGDKRYQSNTTGAFGIGFLAVYQITDEPSLISSGQHWILHEENPEHQRIEVCGGCEQCLSYGLPNTRFVFPWATDPESPLRKALRVEAVTEKTRSTFMEELKHVLPPSLLFLKRIRTIEIKEDGIQHTILRRIDEGDRLTLSNSDESNDQIWHLIRKDFKEEGQRLRAEHPDKIEEKWSTEVTIAISEKEKDKGLLCVCLPSQYETGLPFYINADFFPSNDRKRIIFEADYQSEWNRAAIRAAAKALPLFIDSLKGFLQHLGFWGFISAIKSVSEEVKKGRKESCLGDFWIEIKPTLEDRQVVLTTTGEWKKPREVIILQQEDEESAIPILEHLGFSIVHRDLRSYFNLLREVGVPLLDIPKICQKISETGLNDRLESDSWPEWLNKGEAINLLWKEITQLLEHNKKESPIRTENEKTLSKVSIGPGRDGALWPCGQLYRADARTVHLFESLYLDIPFLDDSKTGFNPLVNLCRIFGIKSAVNWLGRVKSESFQTLWKEGKLDLKALFDWFDLKKDKIREDPNLRRQISQLQIFPSSGELHRLNEVALPGDFEDPIGITTLVDPTMIGNRRDFLLELGIDKLDFRTYVTRYIPEAFENQDLLKDKKRGAVILLAKHIGSIKDDAEIWEILRELPLIECTDGEFRTANLVYFDSEDVHECLEPGTPIVSEVTDHESAIRDLYSQLGVVEKPRIGDVISLIRKVTQERPSLAGKSIIQRIFSHLSKRTEEKELKETYKKLMEIEWLPARGRADCWFRPTDLYAVFQDYLFESQARFLDFPRDLQSRSTTLISVLSIKTSPEPDLVVEHLILCSQKHKPINNQVYQFLENNVSDRSLDKLKGKECLLTPDGKYVEPSRCFWGEHGFGRWRFRLGKDFRAYSKVLEKLGIKETPTWRDALIVLKEISENSPGKHTRLNDEARAVYHRCWVMLDEGLRCEGEVQYKINSLSQTQIILSPQGILYEPDKMFFEDHAGLSKKFGESIANHVIPRDQNTWRAMEAAGVRRLSEVVNTILVECEDPVEDSFLRERLIERKTQILRILDLEEDQGNEFDRTFLGRCQVMRSSVLRVVHEFVGFASPRRSMPEDVRALFIKEHEILYVLMNDGEYPWPSIAREIASALCPDMEPGRIASAIKEVLSAKSETEARESLDELGFASLDKGKDAEIVEGEVIPTLGGEESIPSESGEEPPMGVKDALAALLGSDSPTPTPLPPDLSGQEPARPGGATSGKGQEKDQKAHVGTGGDGHPGPDGKGTKKEGDSRPGYAVLRSYVMPEREGDGAGTDGEAHERRSEVDQAGIDRVMEFERDHGRNPEEMPPKHTGYDIESKRREGEIERYIEVKSLSGAWKGADAGLTRPQFDRATTEKVRYWLYVVERALGDDFGIHCIQDPAGKANRFMFDPGWIQVAEGIEEEVQS